MVSVRQGEIWWTSALDKRRPVLVVTRNQVLDRLGTIVVAPVTRSVRGIPSEIAVGSHEGLPSDGVASFDNLLAIPRHRLDVRAGRLDRPLTRICAALSAMADC